MDVLANVPPFIKGDNLYDFLILFLHQVHSKKGSTLKFPLIVDSFQLE